MEDLPQAFQPIRTDFQDRLYQLGYNAALEATQAAEWRERALKAEAEAERFKRARRAAFVRRVEEAEAQRDRLADALRDLRVFVDESLCDTPTNDYEGGISNARSIILGRPEWQALAPLDEEAS